MAGCPHHLECQCRNVTAEAVSTVVGLIGQRILGLAYEAPSADLPPQIIIEAFTWYTASVLTALMPEDAAFELLRDLADDFPVPTQEDL